MPKLTADPTPPIRPMPEPPPAPPPRAIASDWEDHEGFRFTFLRHFSRPEDTEALQGLSRLLYEMVLEHPRLEWPEQPEPETRWELVAVLAEFRFLEGHLGSIFQEKDKCSLTPEVETLCLFAGGLAYEIGEMGRRLNEELGKWRG